jgi:hypothetical protein
LDLPALISISLHLCTGNNAPSFGLLCNQQTYHKLVSQLHLYIPEPIAPQHACFVFLLPSMPRELWLVCATTIADSVRPLPPVIPSSHSFPYRRGCLHLTLTKYSSLLFISSQQRHHVSIQRVIYTSKKSNESLATITSQIGLLEWSTRWSIPTRVTSVMISFHGSSQRVIHTSKESSRAGQYLTYKSYICNDFLLLPTQSKCLSPHIPQCSTAVLNRSAPS